MPVAGRALRAPMTIATSVARRIEEMPAIDIGSLRTLRPLIRSVMLAEVPLAGLSFVLKVYRRILFCGSAFQLAGHHRHCRSRGGDVT